MIGPDEVNFGEDGTAGQCCGEILYVRYEVTVRDGTTIQCSVVSTRMPVSRCLLGDHVERRCPVAGGGLYDPQVQHMVKLLSSDTEAVGAQSSGAG